MFNKVVMFDTENVILTRDRLYQRCFSSVVLTDPLLMAFPEDGELSIAELLENLDVLNYHFYYGKALMNAFRSIDRDGDGVIR